MNRDDLLAILASLDDDELEDLIDGLPLPIVAALADDLAGLLPAPELPGSLLAQAVELDPQYRDRPHLRYLSDRVTAAVRDVEAGVSRRLLVSMPPRSGKSTSLSFWLPLLILRAHPDWSVALVSHDPALSGAWAKQLRALIEERPDLGVVLSPLFGGGVEWRTTSGGGVYATSVRGALTGRGVRVIVLDDVTKDFVEAHSLTTRQAIWDWWLSVAQTRLEPPSLAIAVATRWHTDDLHGRILSPDFEGDPAEWEVINLPALAEEGDLLGRAVGEPLLSPLLEETPAEAVARWEGVRRSVGSYVFAAMYQGRPAPAQGAIFDVSWWRYWTSDPSRETGDGRVVYLGPDALAGARWLDSWDTAFGGGEAASSGSWVVGQRWARLGPDRFLVAQQRGRWSFTETLERFDAWAGPDDPVTNPFGRFVHQRLVEEKANGAAILDVMRRRVSGLKPVNPRTGKEARARAVTPEIESGNVFLPHPADPGMGWVTSVLLPELREFPHGADDQVDALTQALSGLRDSGGGQVTVPSARQGGLSVVRRASSGALLDVSRAAAVGRPARRA